MKNFDPDATIVQTKRRPFDEAALRQKLEGVDPEVSVLRAKKHLTSRLYGVEGTSQPSSEVSSLIEHRQNTVRSQTRTLEAYITQTQEQEQVPTVPRAAQPSAPVLPPPAPSEQALPGTKVPAQAQKQEGKIPFWQQLRRRRVPVLNQMSMVECGAASLAMIMSYYGRKTTISEVREHCGVGRDGLTALSIVKAARNYGMRVRAISLKENDFRFVTLPAIVHWEFNHFLVVERWTPRHVDLVDPALGRRRVSAEEFDHSFTGVVIMLEPGVNFTRHSALSRVNLRSYAMSYVKRAPAALLQILGASLLLQLFGLALPLLTAVVIDTILPSGMKDAFVLLSIGFLILLLAQLVTTLLRASVLLYLQTRVDTGMMLGFFEQLLALPQHFFLQRSTGDILSRLSSNQVIRDTVSNQLVSTVLDSSFVLVYLVILLSVSPSYALLVVVLGLIQAVLLITTSHPIRDLAKRELVAQGKAQGYIAEALTGISTLKAAGAEQRALQQWSNLFYEQMNVSVRRSYVAALIDTAMTTLRVFSPVILLLVGTVEVLNGLLPLGTMLALNVLAVSFLTPVSSLVTSGQKLQLVHSHLERIADVMEAQPEQDLQSVNEPPRLSGSIRLQHVHFQYDPNSAPVLRDISLTIWPGQKVAIVGKSGSGKSTLGNLLLGLYLPTGGQIYYDAMPLHTLNYQAVRSQFGVVMQNSTIFSGSIRQNIVLNNPAMNMEQVIKAARAAAIHDDIMQMPMEYETFISEGGTGLSGGQRQRVALARALASSPVILLLDEATSALDVLTEQVVEHNLRALACTQITIAHRLSTIRHADLILVLDQGTIVEGGTHEELVKRNGFYARLIQSQLASGEIQAR